MLSGLENPFSKTLLENSKLIEGLLDSVPRVESSYKENVFLWRAQHVHTLHGQPIGFNRNCVMVNFPCGEKLTLAARSEKIAGGLTNRTLCILKVLV